MPQNKIQLAIMERQAGDLPITNLSFADFTSYDTLLCRRKIQGSFANIFSYPYYYPTARGEEEARQAIAEYYAKKPKPLRQEINPENLLLTSAVNQSLLYLFKIFSTEDSEILVANPHSPSLDEIAFFLDIKLKNFSLNPEENWQINLDNLESKITPKTRAIFIATPDLPTGAVQNESTLIKLLELAAKNKITLIVDESMSDFIYGETVYPSISNLQFPDQTVIFLNSLSNGFALPGFKLSWIRFSGNQEIIDDLIGSTEYLADTFLTLNQLSQTVLPELVKYSRKWRKNFVKSIEKNRQILVSKLKKSPQLKLHAPAGGFYSFIEVQDWPNNSDENTASEDFVIALLQETGVYVHPGQYYGQKQGCYFMICFLQDQRTLRSSLKKINKFLKARFSSK
ncbi:pyridoxal phosphate-dependent aminotransferase [Candidatus Peregrinibacteria bacterium]|nr:pyridoxal phosphate-dependent aminotransferase [Candidatus Peregrinibacteria bacterium]